MAFLSPSSAGLNASRAMPALTAALLLGLFLAGTGPAGAGEPRDRPVFHSVNPSVEVIQQRLRRHGYAPGSTNGRLDPQTRRAIRSFERNCGLPAGAPRGTLKDRLQRPSGCPNGGR